MFNRPSTTQLIAAVFAVIVLLGLALVPIDGRMIPEPWDRLFPCGPWFLIGAGIAGLAATIAFHLGVPGARVVLAGLLVVLDLVWIGYCGAFLWTMSMAPEISFRKGKLLTLAFGGPMVLLFAAIGTGCACIAIKEILGRSPARSP